MTPSGAGGPACHRMSVADFRAGLAERGHAYVVGIRGDITVQPHDAHPDAPARSGNGRRPVPRYRQPRVPVAELAAAAGREAFEEVTWREGSRGPMTSRFLAMRVRPAGVRSRRLAQAAAVAGLGRWEGIEHDYREPIHRTHPQILDTLQDLLNCWTGICTTCHQPHPAGPHQDQDRPNGVLPVL